VNSYSRHFTLEEKAMRLGGPHTHSGCGDEKKSPSIPSGI